MDKENRRTSCPVSSFLDILGDRWTLLVIRDLMLGKKYYNEIIQSREKIPTNILADRLKRLEKFDLLTKTPYHHHPVRYEYYLTTKGIELIGVLGEMANWSLRHIPETNPLPDPLMDKFNNRPPVD